MHFFIIHPYAVQIGILLLLSIGFVLNKGGDTLTMGYFDNFDNGFK
jgi:hypothetical protein